MNERIEILREALHEAIEHGDTDEILKASVKLDAEIVDVMIMFYIPNKIMCS